MDLGLFVFESFRLQNYWLRTFRFQDFSAESLFVLNRTIYPTNKLVAYLISNFDVKVNFTCHFKSHGETAIKNHKSSLKSHDEKARFKMYKLRCLHENSISSKMNMRLCISLILLTIVKNGFGMENPENWHWTKLIQSIKARNVIIKRNS